MQEDRVDDLLDLARTAPPATFVYGPSPVRDVVEVASVRGCAVALPVHFHDEDQVTFVLSGRRRFEIGGRRVEVTPGRAVLIRAGIPHETLDEPEVVVCLNAYVPAHGDAERLVAAMERRWDELGDRSGPALEVDRPPVATSGSFTQADARTLRGTVLGASARAGMSREAFSRAFRRTHGVAPSVFRSLAALNQARRLLRAGTPLAAVAAEAGFADQSHLGRCFRRAFGVTPGHYRKAWSHPFQTGSGQGD